MIFSAATTVTQHQHALYPTTVSTAIIDHFSLSKALFEIFYAYNWSSIYVIYDTRDKFVYCSETARAIRVYHELQASSNITLTFDGVGESIPIQYSQVLRRSATMSRGNVHAVLQPVQTYI